MPTPTPELFIDAFSLKPAAAIAHLQQKGMAITWNWHDQWKDAHSRAFTVAKVMKMDILQDIRDMVDKATNDGMSFGQFKKELEPKLREKGWWGKKEIVNKETGEITEIQEGSVRRLKTIYNTNLQTQYAAGRYQAQTANSKHMPYWQFVAIVDKNTTDRCRSLDGMVFRFDDPIWEKFYPPNHWGCRSRVRALTERILDRERLVPQSSSDRIVEREVEVGGQTRTVSGFKTGRFDKNGNPITYWTDPGWDYNPGQGIFAKDISKAPEVTARQFVRDNVNGPAFQQFIASKGDTPGTFPVAVLPKHYMEKIGAAEHIVSLSDETLRKNVRNHPELKIDDYRRVQDVIENAELIIQDGDQTMVFVRRAGKIYHAAIKATRTGKGLFLTSLRLTDERAIEQAKRRGEVIRNSLK